MKFEVWVATNKIRSKCSQTVDFDEEDWNNMTEDDREQAMYDIVVQSGMFEWGYKEEP